MKAFFNQFANFLFPIRNLLLFVFLTAFCVFFYLMVFTNIELQNTYLMPCFLILLWGLLLFVLCHSFHGDEQSNNSGKGWFSRLKIKLLSLFIWIYSVVFIALIFISIHFTLKVTFL